MLKIFPVVVFFFAFNFLPAQIPPTCFEIESVLVDACANPEGANEMLRFRTGSTPLNIADLNIQWPNTMNLWFGVCQNSTTALKVDSINQTIQGCGILIEPTAGILPAGKQILLLTSTDIQSLGHSFANLNDTLYVIFQCSGNTAGHFGNFGTGTRTLIMNFSSPANCADTVEYDREMLVNIYDSTGGTTAAQNGSSVAYEWEGTPTYFNKGCVAPFIPVSVDAGNDTVVCEGSMVRLSGSIESVASIRWWSAQGIFDSIGILNPLFTPQPNIIYPISIFLVAYTSCDSISDTLMLNKHLVSISAGSDQTICLGKSATLNGSGANFYNWSENGNFFSNQPNPSASPVTTTTYVLNGVDSLHNCSATDTVIVMVNQKDSLVATVSSNQVCYGQSLTVSVTGGTSYTWSPNDGSISDVSSPNPVITPFTSTIYVVSTDGSCADTVSFFINMLQNDSIIVTSAADSICEGDSVQLFAAGANEFLWFPDDGSLNDVTISNPVAHPVATAIYSVRSLSVCPDTASIQIEVITPVEIFIAPDSAGVCQGDSVQLTVSGSANVEWSSAPELSCTNCLNPVASPIATTAYIVTEKFCRAQDSITVTVVPLPAVTISDDTTIFSGESVVLNASGGNFYLWNPSVTLNVPDLSIVTASPLATTTYSVVVSDGFCNAQASVTVTVREKECPHPVVPTAFTPNGDSRNDLFGLLNAFNYSSSELHIYNRWGENVFSSGNFEKWDGYYHGEEQPIGVFAYTLRATCPDGKKAGVKGSVTLIR